MSVIGFVHFLFQTSFKKRFLYPSLPSEWNDDIFKIYNVKPTYLNVTQCGLKYHFAAPIWASYLVAQLVAFFWHLVWFIHPRNCGRKRSEGMEKGVQKDEKHIAHEGGGSQYRKPAEHLSLLSIRPSISFVTQQREEERGGGDGTGAGCLRLFLPSCVHLLSSP